MRALILGGDGMLGHELQLRWSPRHEVWVTLRKARGAYGPRAEAFGPRALFGVDARLDGPVAEALSRARPEVVVNAVGIVKQREAAHDPVLSIEVNALLPHRLARLCRAAGARLVHVSTDCVFSGARGGYTEGDAPDPVDLYGRSKWLGEVADQPHVLTLRTSIIGLELSRATGLVEWFLAQRGTVPGYRRAIYTGLTTAELSRALEQLALEPGPAPLHGLWHLAAARIDKHDLLTRLARRLGRTDVTIVPDDAVACDRSLDGRALEARSSYRVPSWDAMLDELAESIQRRGTAS
jgi:dTDP-4-dehydrorhamnose reductase